MKLINFFMLLLFLSFKSVIPAASQEAYTSKSVGEALLQMAACNACNNKDHMVSVRDADLESDDEDAVISGPPCYIMKPIIYTAIVIAVLYGLNEISKNI